MAARIIYQLTRWRWRRIPFDDITPGMIFRSYDAHTRSLVGYYKAHSKPFRMKFNNQAVKATPLSGGHIAMLQKRMRRQRRMATLIIILSVLTIIFCLHQPPFAHSGARPSQDDKCDHDNKGEPNDKGEPEGRTGGTSSPGPSTPDQDNDGPVFERPCGDSIYFNGIRCDDNIKPSW